MRSWNNQGTSLLPRAHVFGCPYMSSTLSSKMGRRNQSGKEGSDKRSLLVSLLIIQPTCIWFSTLGLNISTHNIMSLLMLTLLQSQLYLPNFLGIRSLRGSLRLTERDILIHWISVLWLIWGLMCLNDLPFCHQMIGYQTDLRECHALAPLDAVLDHTTLMEQAANVPEGASSTGNESAIQKSGDSFQPIPSPTSVVTDGVPQLSLMILSPPTSLANTRPPIEPKPWPVRMVNDPIGLSGLKICQKAW